MKTIFCLLVTVLSLVLLLVVFESDCSCIYGDIRLMGGFGDYEGNVQVCIDGVWGYVCHNYWDASNARVVCRQLGYNTTDVVKKSVSYYGYGNGTVWMDYVHCTGSEDRLIDCPSNLGLGVTYCAYSGMAGVYCACGNCINGDIRLAATSTWAGRSEGRVEVCYNNEWGTVCSHGWGGTEATVACKQLGYTGYINYYTGNKGKGSGPIWFDDMSCSSSHSSLFDCTYNTATSDCTHSNDVQVTCYATDPISSCTNNGQVKLWSAYDSTPAEEGIPLVCVSGTWYPMIDFSNCYATQLACKAAGYAGRKGYDDNGGRNFGYYYSTHYRFYCSSSATSLNSCSKSSYSKGSYYDNSLRIKCYTEQNIANNCIEGSVRLINGKTNNEGGAEYCYKNKWAPFCLMNQYTANLVCKQLGYTNPFGYYLISRHTEFGESDTISPFVSLSCNSGSTSLSDQCYIQKSQSCYSSPSCNDNYIGLRCYELITNECNDGDTRLVGGRIEQEGRPEVCVNGIWGQICHDGWDVNDAYVTCVTLGYNGTIDPTNYTYSEFGAGYGPIVWNDVTCYHWNNNIHNCSKTIFPDFYCDSYGIAGIQCTEGCSDGDIRLVGGSSVHEGTVEVCFDELWGLISDEGWSDNDARAVCTQLGYSGEDFVSQLGSYYGKPNKTIHLKNVSCLSHETNISECTSTRLTLTVGKTLRYNTEVAGVYCNPVQTTPCAVNESCTSQGSIRVLGSGGATEGGKVEYCNGTYWSPLCGVDNKMSTVICRQLGYTSYSWSSLILYESNGEVSTVSNITCNGQEDSITDCLVTNGCTECKNHTVGLKCFDISDDFTKCEEGSIRLVNGSSSSEGRVEVCVNGVWGSVCDNGWDSTDGHVICYQLGYTREKPTVYYDSYFGDGSYPIVYSNVNCEGWEDNISECNKDDHLSFTCYPGDGAGLRCNGNLSIVDTPPVTTTNTYTSVTTTNASVTNTSTTITTNGATVTTTRPVVSDGGESVVTIVGVILGAVSLVAIIIVVIVLLHFKRALNKRQPLNNEAIIASDLKNNEEDLTHDYEENTYQINKQLLY